ncbi:maleylpyruvate isomerase family mycothiol-dependent enzyme [Nocardia uniformis]|uniref:Maleylpyruvate isomerase family mycothiol-dependent enzyme n=1 Tax=Nocardia uniformis TaxID=53432 RepID=A0A849BP02_9NOCA|nr:maleylpyruvate isomerase family mycothiol-dependent enzyme [Nocardia uniformis]NNH68442.1 maleylpyruvate isomerase family mycothiol-dependent enzyme [Nocardia uniformis]
MTPTSDEIWQAVAAERVTLLELLEGLSESDWDRPSLCDGWRVRDVAAHVILSSSPTIAALLINLIRARGNLTRLSRDTAIRHADRSPSRQLLVQLRATIPLRVAAPGTTPTDRLMDLLVHIQDIAIPLGLSRDMPTASARLALDRVWTMNWPFHAHRKLSPYRLIATDTHWTVGTGPTIEAPIADLLLLATGRTAKLATLDGDGAFLLRNDLG